MLVQYARGVECKCILFVLVPSEFRRELAEKKSPRENRWRREEQAIIGAAGNKTHIEDRVAKKSPFGEEETSV